MSARSESSYEHYIPQNVYDSKRSLGQKQVEKNQSLKRGSTSQSKLQKYNLSRNDMTERLNQLDGHNTRYSITSNQCLQMQKDASSSLIRMMQKLEQNLHKNLNQVPLQDILIEKRRLVSSQGRRFCAIKVNRFQPNKEDPTGDKIKKKIDAEILKYQNTVTQKEDKGISNQASLLKDDLEFDREASVDKLQSIKVKLTPLEEEHKIKTNKHAHGNSEYSPFMINEPNEKISSSQSIDFEQGCGPSKNKVEIIIDSVVHPRENVYDNNSLLSKGSKHKGMHSFDSLKSEKRETRHVYSYTNYRKRSNSKRGSKDSSFDKSKESILNSEKKGVKTPHSNRREIKTSRNKSLGLHSASFANVIKSKHSLIINPEAQIFKPDLTRYGVAMSNHDHSSSLQDLLEHRQLTGSRNRSGTSLKTPSLQVETKNIIPKETQNKDLEQISHSITNEVSYH